MIDLFRHNKSFSVAPGLEPIVVAAPHDGTRPHTDSDIATGPIARALADRLQARCVVASNLRRAADVNKNPLSLNKGVRAYALRYQNEVFDGLPRLVVEVHGHATGKYTVEVSSGFDLDPALPGDLVFLERLRALKQALGTQLARIGIQADVGVYPLDRDVVKTATNTYTFQKVRRARNEVGMEWYGLHLELAADLRTGQSSRVPGHFERLAEAFSSAIASAFLPLPDRDAVIPVRTLPLEQVASGKRLRVARAADGPGYTMRAELNAQQADILGFLEGDLIALYNHGQTLQLPVSSSARVRSGQIAIPAKARGQLGLRPGNPVVAVIPGHQAATTAANVRAAFVVGGSRPGGQSQIWLHLGRLDGLQAVPDQFPRVYIPTPAAASVPVQLSPDESAPQRVAFVSQKLLRRLNLTMGDTIVIGTDK